VWLGDMGAVSAVEGRSGAKATRGIGGEGTYIVCNTSELGWATRELRGSDEQRSV
jgi:hypothetical protein